MLMTCIACIASLIESMLIACIASHSMHVIASIAMGSILTPFIGTPPGPPGRPAGEISGGGKFRGRPGARAPPGPRAPGAQNGPFRAYIYCFSYYSGGFLGGALLAPPGPPGGQKSAHFFGYLITLPVGTVWALFFHPPFWDSLGLCRFGQCL